MEAGQDFVKAWQFQDVLLESYYYTPGPSKAFPRHFHEGYQFALNLSNPLSNLGQYYYRGTNHLLPVGSLTIIHPGELHQPCPPAVRLAPTLFREMYVPVAMMRQAAAVAGRDIDLPFFAEPTISNPDLTARFLNLHKTLEGNASQLESESELLLALTQVIAGFAQDHPPLSTPGVERTAVWRVREYLEENYAHKVSLAELVRLTDLSAFHLIRVFAKEVGLTPHAYQTQVRIARAKTLLISGLPPGRVAIAVGFYDQPHFGKHFKRLVGVTPRRYVGDRKNLLDE